MYWKQQAEFHNPQTSQKTYLLFCSWWDLKHSWMFFFKSMINFFSSLPLWLGLHKAWSRFKEEKGKRKTKRQKKRQGGRNEKRALRVYDCLWLLFSHHLPQPVWSGTSHFLLSVFIYDSTYLRITEEHLNICSWDRSNSMKRCFAICPKFFMQILSFPSKHENNFDRGSFDDN